MTKEDGKRKETTRRRLQMFKRDNHQDPSKKGWQQGWAKGQQTSLSKKKKTLDDKE